MNGACSASGISRGGLDIDIDIERCLLVAYHVVGLMICIWHCFECEMGLSQHKSPKSFTSL